MTTLIPYVDYLVLGEQPHLIAHRCTSCDARFFDHRTVCASCFGTEFDDVELPRTGTVRTFTIVHVAAPGITTPFIAAVVDCGGTLVPGRLVGVEQTPDHVAVGMPVVLSIHTVGTDSLGTDAIGYAFTPS